MYIVLTNKYSHETSSAERVLSKHHVLQEAKDVANDAAKTRRWARVIDEQTMKELYRRDGSIHDHE